MGIEVTRNCCESDSKADKLWDALSEVYNITGLPDRVYEIVGDVMLKLHDDESERKHGTWITAGSEDGGMFCEPCKYEDEK